MQRSTSLLLGVLIASLFALALPGMAQTLAAPVLSSPVDSATGVSDITALLWTPVTGATVYDVQVSTDATFATNLVVNAQGLTASLYTIPAGDLTDNTLYFWEVEARNATTTSAWSYVSRFTTGTTANATLTITPATVTLTPGGTQQFTATPATGVTWTINVITGTQAGGVLGTIDANGLFTAPSGGSDSITATSANGTATAYITLIPLTVAPTTVTLAPGATQQFTATPNTGATWGATGGTINTTGLYTAGTTPGTFMVTVTSGFPSNAQEALVTISPAALTVTPATVTLAPGGTQQFTATPATGVTWSAVSGTITAAGLYTAPTTTGTDTVTATAGTATATATVTISNAVLTVAPATITLIAGATQQFTATPATGVTWTADAALGTIDTTGLLTVSATVPIGIYTVTATSATATATATVLVAQGIAAFIVTPQSVTLNPGDIQQFTATTNTVLQPVPVVEGGTAVIAVTWTATGGTIDQTGLYTAGATPGAYAVTATSGTSIGSAAVTIAGTSGTVTTVAVPGTACPYFAGQADGITVMGDSTPNESPVPVDVTGMTAIQVVATGAVNNSPTVPQGGRDANGNGQNITANNAYQLGVSLANAPMNSLLGVFLNNGQLFTGNLPQQVDGKSTTPQLGQVFEIGDNATITLPTGATTLYLGSQDTWGWANNSGQFQVTVTDVSNDTLTTPTLTSPTNGTTGVDPTNATLTWLAEANATQYQVEYIYNNYNGQHTTTVTVTTNSVTLTTLQLNTQYTWRVQAQAQNGTNSHWSNEWNFTTSNGQPGAVTLLSPANGTTNVNPASGVTFTWQAASNTTGYQLQYTTNAYGNGNGNWISQTVTNGTSYTLVTLEANQTYTWRVRATNALGDGGWSDQWTFATSGPPAAPALTSPANGATGVDYNNVTLAWAAVTGSTGYEVQLATDRAFTAPLLDTTTTTLTAMVTSSNVGAGLISALQPLTTYYWRVNASNAIGAGAWSTVWSFTTHKQPGMKPALLISTSAAQQWNANVGVTAPAALTVAPGNSGIYYLQLQNTGTVVDSYAVTCSAPTTGWTLTAFDNADDDITTALIGTGWVVAVTPEAPTFFKLVVAPTTSAPAALTLTLSAASQTDNTLTSIVTTDTTAIALAAPTTPGTVGVTPVAVTPDLMVLRPDGTGWIGGNVFGPSDTQTLIKYTTGGVASTFVVAIANDGSTAGTITLTAPAAPTGWTVTYTTPAGTNISTQITAATGYALTLGPGAAEDITVQVTPASTIANYSGLVVPIVATNGATTPATDTMQLVTQRMPASMTPTGTSMIYAPTPVPIEPNL